MKLRAPLVAVMLLLVIVAPASAQQGVIGMVADDNSHSVVVFDAVTDTVLGTVSVGSGAVGDCSITRDQTLGFVTDFNYRIWVIDLTTSPPSLAAGTNPIPISNYGEDTTITPDQRYLVVSNGGASQPLSVIDIASRTEINTFWVGTDHNSVEALCDGSVLVTSALDDAVYRLTIDGAGNLVDTGDVLPTGVAPNNTFSAPGDRSGLVITRDWPGEVRSFTIPGLTPVDTRSLTGGDFGISGLVNPAGTRVYARGNGPTDGDVDVFDYDSGTGALGAAPLFSIPIANDPYTNFGMDQMAMTPDGKKLYVSEPGALNVYDADTGAPLTAITHPQIREPTGVCFAVAECPQPVGGQLVPVSRAEVVAPWLGLAAVVTLVLVAASLTINRRKS